MAWCGGGVPRGSVLRLGTAIVSTPLHHLQVAMLGRRQARFLLVPWATVGASPLQNSQVAIQGRILTRVLVQWATIGSSPLQNSKVAIQGRILARARSMGSHFLWPTAKSIGGHSRPQTSTSTRPTGNHFLWPTAKQPGSHSWPHTYTSARPMGNHFL